MEPKTGVLTPSDISLLAGLPNIGVLAGLPLSTFLADRYGRRKALICACAISAVAAAIQTAAFGLAALIVGRVIARMSLSISY